MNPIIPERPRQEQPAPPAPTFVVMPEVVQEQTAAAERIEIAAKIWALLKFQDLTRAQAAIDWSKDVSARLMALVRTHQEAAEWIFLALSLGFFLLWAGSRLW